MAPDPADRDRDIAREIADHLELEAEALQRDGESPEAARRRARLAFGSPALATEDAGAVWRAVWWERLVYDVRHAVRGWRRTPGLALVAIGTMAVSIGAGTALVGQVNAVFWQPLPIDAAEQLRLVTWSAPRFPYVSGGSLNAVAGPAIAGTPTFTTFSYPAYQAMREAASGFDELACWGDYGEARPVALGELGFANVHFVSGNYFRALRVRARLGRTLEPDDDDGAAGWSRVAVVTDRFWRRALGADPAATTRTLSVNGQRVSVVGVLPGEYTGLDQASVPDVLLPIGALELSAQTSSPLANPRIWSLCRVVGRSTGRGSDEQARLAMEQALAASIAATPPPEAYDPPRVWVTPGEHGLSTLRDATATPLAILVAGVGLLLAAACANISGLLLTRGRARGREIATRLALGAPRGRLVRQLVTESLVLAVIGGALGIAVAAALSEAARAFLSQFLPTFFGADRALAVTGGVDTRVLLLALVATTACGLAFGIGPALGATRLDLIAAIRRGDGGWQTRRSRGGTLLVGAQAALAMLLLVAAGLFVRTVTNLRAVDLGFPQEGLLYARVAPRSGNIPADRRGQFVRDALDRIAELPGVAAASAATTLPLGGSTNVGSEPSTAFCLAGHTAAGRPPFDAAISQVAPGYFDALGVPLRAGRDLTWADGPSTRAIVVSEEFARQAWPDAPSDHGVGARVGMCGVPNVEWQVAGVVADVATRGRSGPRPTAYWPIENAGVPITLVVRTSADPSALIPSVRRAVRSVNADVPTFSEATAPALRERTLRRERLLSLLLGGFGGVTALICALGIYALLSHAVSRRRSEIGIRLAIGATAADVVRLVCRGSLAAVAAGGVIGLLASLALSRALGSLLFGVADVDPVVLGGAASTFTAVAVAAAVLPARAATRVDPLTALRQI